jgi:hypothetical protein
MTDLLTRIEQGQPVKAQEIFDYSVSKVIEQGVQARGAQNQCAYRGENGTKCTFGHVIPDALYKRSMEGMNAKALLCTEPMYSINNATALQPSLEVHVDLLEALQAAHDNVSANNFVPNFRRRAEAIAATHGLTFKF